MLMHFVIVSLSLLSIYNRLKKDSVNKNITILYWASVLALIVAFTAGMQLSNQERRLIRAL